MIRYFFISLSVGRPGPGGSASPEDRAAVGDPGGAERADAPVQGAGRRLRRQAAPRRHEEEGAPGQRAQVHGHLPQAAHVLLTLRGLHLVSLSYIKTALLMA